MKRKSCPIDPEEEALLDLQELEALAAEIPFHTEDHQFQMKVYETVELLQEVSPFSQAESTIRRLIAQFGEAYFFFNKTGDLCFLTDFVSSAKNAEKEFV
ncbi:MAG: hypothetical protein JSS32_07250 [Verrucomicrobia bacterium]|nr:hypothetical protein [Verrucomicrobiota bacterium]